MTTTRDETVSDTRDLRGLTVTFYLSGDSRLHRGVVHLDKKARVDVFVEEDGQRRRIDNVWKSTLLSVEDPGPAVISFQPLPGEEVEKPGQPALWFSELPARPAKKRTPTKRAPAPERVVVPAVTIRLNSPLPEIGQRCRIGCDEFEVVAYAPSPTLMQFTYQGTVSLSPDVPLVQRFHNGTQKMGEPFLQTRFAELPWFTPEKKGGAS